MTTEGTEKRAPRKQTAAKKASARRAPRSESTKASREKTPPRPPKASEVADNAVRQLVELTGREPEGVTGLEATDDGWRVSIDVLDLHRVPETTDVLACYEVEVDKQGDLTGYRRVHRYVRGSAGEERG